MDPTATSIPSPMGIIAPYDARQIANRLLDLGARSNSPLTALKLHKILYFCYGFFLIQRNEKLFHNNIEAWKYGPVVRVVWDQFKKEAREPITERAIYFDFNSGKNTRASPELSPEDEEIVESVFEDCRHHAAWTLAKMTHEPGSGWHKIWYAPPGSVSLGGRIGDELIRAEFLERVRTAIRA